MFGNLRQSTMISLAGLAVALLTVVPGSAPHAQSATSVNPASPRIEAGRRLAAARAAAQASRFSPGKTFKDCADCPEMVVIPAGSFHMGDLNGGGSSDEKPVHRVTIAKAFAVGKYEVTQAQWRSVMGNNPSRFKGDRNPVEQVSWNDAKEFVRKLSAKTGKNYRLLSESEWEYAARAKSTSKYSWGNSISSSQANYDRNIGETKTIGSYAANGFGLYDMHGNVWEWVEDCYKGSYSNAPADSSAVTGSNSCRRVGRGGSWNIDPRNLRSSFRLRNSPDFRYFTLGFRLARTL